MLVCERLVSGMLAVDPESKTVSMIYPSMSPSVQVWTGLITWGPHRTDKQTDMTENITFLQTTYLDGKFRL